MSDVNTLEFECPRVPCFGSFKLGLAQWREDQTCSECGSLSEDAFMAAVRRGDEIVPGHFYALPFFCVAERSQ